MEWAEYYAEEKAAIDAINASLDALLILLAIGD